MGKTISLPKDIYTFSHPIKVLIKLLDGYMAIEK